MKTLRSFILSLSALALLSLFPLSLFSQEAGTCAENLKEAQNQFGKGHVELISGLLNECMKSGFKSDEQLSAYKLLIQASLFEDKLTEADSSMLSFLKKYPEYQLSPTDHSSFVYLFNSFKVNSFLQLSVHLGLNLPYLTVLEQKSTSMKPQAGKYSTTIGNFYGSVEAKIPINNKLEVNIEGALSQIKFSKTEDFLTFSKINYTETQQRFELPISVTYNIVTLGKFTPFVRAGFGPALTLSSTAKPSDVPFDLSSSELHTGADISRTDSRFLLNLFAQAGAGVKYKIPRGFLNLEVRLNPGLQTQPDYGSTSEHSLGYTYYYKDDVFFLSTLNISVGYTYIFYKSSKRK